MPTVADLVTYMETIAPPSLAASWDNVGLLLGDTRSPIRRVLTCLTLTPDVAAEAVNGDFQVIVTHHPVLFRGAKRLTADTTEGESLLALARANIAVYSPHTGFDDAVGGINDQLCDRLGVGERRPLRFKEAPGEFKVTVFVPENDLAKVSDAMFAAGAGQIGEYRECGFRTSGIGTFFGGEATRPMVGQKGRREEVAEFRLEIVCPRHLLPSVLAAIRSAHSYEVPAVDVYPLADSRQTVGSGRVGTLAVATSLGELARQLSGALGCARMQIIGDPNLPIKRVAVACGAAGEMLADAIRARVDLFVTGEMRFHECLTARSAGVCSILPGHFASERFALEVLAERIQHAVPYVSACASRVERDPTTWI